MFKPIDKQEEDYISRSSAGSDHAEMIYFRDKDALGGSFGQDSQYGLVIVRRYYKLESLVQILNENKKKIEREYVHLPKQVQDHIGYKKYATRSTYYDNCDIVAKDTKPCWLRADEIPQLPEGITLENWKQTSQHVFEMTHAELVKAITFMAQSPDSEDLQQEYHANIEEAYQAKLRNSSSILCAERPVDVLLKGNDDSAWRKAVPRFSDAIRLVLLLKEAGATENFHSLMKRSGMIPD